MATITGKLETFYEDDVDAIATLDIYLCNYGAQIPRSRGAAMLADVAIIGLVPDPTAHTFSFTVAGNDVIQPAGTYYTVTVKNGNGDIIQINAYIWLDNQDYDLGTAQPIDPALPAPILPPAVINQLVTFAYQPTIGVDLDNNATAFAFPLEGDMVVNFFIKGPPGNLYTLIVQQDATGGHNLTWADTVQNATAINKLPNGMTTQTFVSDVDGNLYAIGAGTYQ